MDNGLSTIIVPSYMKANTIVECINGLLLTHQSYDIGEICIIVVIDGDDDGTYQKLTLNHIEKLKVIVLPSNSGKGAAIKTALKVTESRYVAFFDADLDIEPSVLFEGLRRLRDNSNLSGVAGSKSHPDSVLIYPRARRVYSVIFKLLVKLMFNQKVVDSQTGIKAFRMESIQDHYSECEENGFLFELELMIRMLRENQRIEYIPVRINHKFGSTINIFSAFRILLDLIRLKCREKKNL